MFSSRSLMISGLILKSLIHFLNFGVLCETVVQLLQHHLSDTVLCPLYYSCLFCHELIDHIYVSLIPGSLFCSMSVLNVHTILFWFLQLCNTLWNQWHAAFSFVLFQDCFAYSGSSVVPYKFYNYLFCFCEAYQWHFDRDSTKSVACLG